MRIDFPDLTFAAYRYDGFDRRIEKDVNGTVTRYLYDDLEILLEYDGTNLLLARYAHGPGIDSPVMVERDGNGDGFFDASERFFYHSDGLGSITELTDSTGAVARALVTDSYGRIVQDTGGVESPFAFTGREFDAESGLYFYRARYYDPATGRFLSKDPIGFLGGDINLYSYVGNNPINFTDPLGLAKRVCKANVIGDRDDKGEKICTYRCTCRDGCKVRTFTVDFPAGAGHAAVCIGQFIDQIAVPPTSKIREFDFDTESFFDRYIAGPPKAFIDKVGNIFDASPP